MKNTYFDLIEQTYYFPQDGFDLQDGYLNIHGVSIKLRGRATCLTAL